jgi:uncharacterized membrane protein YsdA (DUF1294 family)
MSYLPVICFLLLYAWTSLMRALPWTVGLAYLCVSLLGGWPGAVVAQQWFRHKTAKFSFRVAFWCTVALNLAGFILLAQRLPET